jgi:hypothetical protein
VARAPLLAVVALLATLLPHTAGAVAKGEERVLVILATSGPKPYSVGDVEQTVGEVDTFFQRSSSGQSRLKSDVTPWLAAFARNPGCSGLTRESFEAVIAPARTAASRAGYESARYDSTVYALAETRCAFHGETWGREVMLTRQPTMHVMIHELGHALGLGHAQATNCPNGPVVAGCDVDSTGDPFSPMGSGTMDFSAYEKSILGWIGPPLRITAPKRVTIATPTYATKQPQAIVVDTWQGKWWLEYRSQFRGLLIRFVADQGPRSPFATPSVLIMRPKKIDRPWLARGETYRIPFSYRVTLERAGVAQATVRFRF